MSKAIYWQRGETIDYKNETNTIIEAGTILPIGNRIGVAGTEINPHALGSVHVTGVFEMPKADAQEIEIGTDVYFDGSFISMTGSGTVVGYAIEKADAADKTIKIKLLG